MSDERIIVLSPSKTPICYACFMPLKEWGEYHPHEFCVLYRNGVKDPAAFVDEVHAKIHKEVSPCPAPEEK
jgi:hypothetical protein